MRPVRPMAVLLVRGVAALAVAAIASACGTVTTSAAPGSSATASTAASAGASAGGAPGGPTLVPPFGDVTSYRVDAVGSVVEPGPAPTGTPALAWTVQVGQTHWSPILVGGNLIVGTTDGILVALDGRTGGERWRFHAPEGFDTESLNGAASAAGGLLFVASPTTVYAIDAASGVKRWATPVASKGSRTLAVGGRVYVGSVGGAVGLDQATGAVVWRWTGPAGIPMTIGPASDGIDYVSSRADGRLYAVDLATGEQRWSVQTISLAVGTAEVVGSSVYVATNQAGATQPVGELYAIDATTQSIRWRYRSPSGLQLVAGPVLDGVLFAGSEQDGITALRDDGSKATQVWHTDAPPTYFPLSLTGQILFEQRNDGSVGAYGTPDGHLVWQTPATTDTGGGPPLVSGGMVFTVGDHGSVSAYADPSLLAALPTAAPAASTASTPGASPATGNVPDLFTVTRSVPWASLSLAIPLGMAAGPDGLLYVLDTKPSVVVIDPADGHVVRTWGSQGSANGQFDLTRADDNPGIGDIAVAPNGQVYVADGSNHRVQVFTRDGKYLRQFGSYGTGDGQFGSVDEIAIGPDGGVYVRDLGTNRISRFTGDGTFVWNSPAAGSDPDMGVSVQGLAIGPDGAIYVACEGCSYLVQLDPATGRVKARLAQPVLNGLAGPLSTDPAGRIYVTLFDSGTTLVLDRAGTLVGARAISGSMMSMSINKQVTWGDPFWPSPVFLPDGRAFTFWKDGLAELKVTGATG